MKYKKFPKRQFKKEVFIQETRGTLDKPKIPLRYFSKIHKTEGKIEFVFKD